MEMVEILNEIREMDVKDEPRIYRAYFGQEEWYVKVNQQGMWYCDENGETGEEGRVTVANSNIRAEYEEVR